MTDALPEPLVTAEVDLRDFAFTPMYRARLFGSAFHARVTDAEWRAGVTLWLKSQDQAPSGSLPDDDIDLCRLAELGRDLKTWRKIRPGALRGWVKCSDGRLYHRVIAEIVTAQWKGKQAQRDRTEKARLARQSQRAQTSVTDTKREGQGEVRDSEGTGIDQTSLRSSERADAPDPMEIPPELDRRQPNGHAKTARGSRLSADWQPNAEDREFARQCGLDVERTAAEFRDYWVAVAGAKGVKLDWSATFRNRCRALAERAGSPLRAEAPTGHVLPERRRPKSPPRPEDLEGPIGDV